ncbi:MAG: hypothetical protein QOD12_2049 [Verrucomicrobiota bacterium]|jgi:hypothetical protein
MKTCLLVCLLIAAAFPAAAETYTIRTARDKSKPRQTPNAPVTRKVEVTGVIPRGVRGGNFLQMFNPKAPRKYGTSQEAIAYDQDNPAKWKGIKFFEFRF